MDDAADTMAAELALDLLDGEERAGALRRTLAEPGFAAEVAWWRDAFSLLVPAVPDATPDDAVLARVERSIDGTAAVAPVRRGWTWPTLAGISSMAAAALLAVVLTRPATVPVQAPAVPALLAAAVVPDAAAVSAAPMSAVYDPASGALRLTAAAMADARHSAELWVIGGDGVPHSLGLLRDGATTAMTVTPANRPRLVAASVLAVSMEPVGGSRTGAPTGPVVAKGTLART